jgi:hypothetical protein
MHLNLIDIIKTIKAGQPVLACDLRAAVLVLAAVVPESTLQELSDTMDALHKAGITPR